MAEVEMGPRRGAILVVEDHEDVRVGLSQLLALNGFLVADAADAEHAIDHLRAYPNGFALMLLDLLLPGLSGTDLRVRQLADPQLSAIPVVVVSAYEPEPTVEARLKPAAWLEKPFRGDDLLKIVRRYVAPEMDVVAPEMDVAASEMDVAAPEMDVAAPEMDVAAPDADI